MAVFDYTAPAELFVGRARGTMRGKPITYRRFSTSAEAIQYAVETLQAGGGTVLVVGEDRYEAEHIRELYDDAAYPLGRSLA
jgi:hypothetical protein